MGERRAPYWGVWSTQGAAPPSAPGIKKGPVGRREDCIPRQEVRDKRAVEVNICLLASKCVWGGEWFLHPLRLVTGTCELNGQKTHEREKGLFHIHTGSLTKKKKPLKSNEAGSLYTMLTEGNKPGKVTRQIKEVWASLGSKLWAGGYMGEINGKQGLLRFVYADPSRC